MNKQTELIRLILDAATADKLDDAVKAINEYVEDEVINFEKYIGAGERLSNSLRADFKEYLKQNP